jgi:signal transduction histidine kinase/DNA-binding response OmpR family regulator
VISNWHSIILRRTAFCEDHKGNIWIGTRDAGLNRYNRDKDNFTRYPHKEEDINSLSHNYVTRIFEDSQNRLWVGTWGGGINRLNHKTGTFTRIRHQAGNDNSPGSDRCIYIDEDRSNNLWFSSEFALDRLDHEKNKWIHFKNEGIFPKNDTWTWTFIPFHQDEKGILWFFAPSGKLLLLDPDKNTHNLVQQNSQNHYGIHTAANITAISKDQAYNLWFGTNCRGIYKLDPYAQHFHTIIHDPGDFNSLSSNSITCMLKSKLQQNRIWVGTSNGLDIFNPKTMKVDHEPAMQKLFKGKTISALLEDEFETLWIGTRLDGLYKYDLKNGRLFHYSYRSVDGITNSLFTIWSIFKDKANELWILNNATPYGLSRFTKNVLFKHYKFETQYSESNLLNMGFCFCDEDENSFWVGTKSGLYLYHMKLDRFIRHFLDGYEIFRIFKDSKKNFWIGTTFNGFGLFDPKTGRVVFYNDRHGLSHNKVNSIIEDDEGYLWLSTDGGLSKFDPVNKTFTNYYCEHGLPSAIFHPAELKLESGEIWMATIDGGIVAFNPKDIKLNPIPPKVVLTNFRISNESVTIGKDSPLQADITVTKDIHLSHWQNDISIEVTALHYSHPSKNRYAYRLENHDKDWLYTGTNRIATYTNLDPGKYTFRARAANSDGVWNEAGVSLHIIIDPPWWKTWWAYGLYVVLFGAIVYGAFRYQLNRARMKQELILEKEHAEKLEEIDQIKSRFFTNISHEFRTPLTLILGPLENLFSKTTGKKLKTEYSIMLRNGRRLLQLINQLLDFSKLEAGHMTIYRKTENIVQLLKGIVGSFASAADQKNISLTFKTQEDKVLASVDPDKFEKILTNLLSNALKFTHEGGRIEVVLNLIKLDQIESQVKKENLLEIIVSDTGIGISAEHLKHIFDRFYQADPSQTRKHEGTGLGLALTKELVELHDGKISVVSEEGVGTTFKVYLHVGKPEDQEISVDEQMEHRVDDVGFEEESIEEIEKVGSKKRAPKPIVLVVEDNMDVQLYIKGLLSSQYSMEQAKDGLEGFEKATSIIPDLIINDVMMPYMDGFELCEKLKTDERTSHIPIIMLTARATDSSKLKGLEIGADDYLIKPFNPKELRIRVKNLIDQRAKLRERFSKEIILQPRDIAVTSMDERFLQRAMEIVEAHMGDSDFHIEHFCLEIGMSRVQLHRKLRALVNQSTTEFIRSLRLKRAADLLRKKAGNVTEVAFQVGFNDSAYFTACFRKQFGVSPKKYTA